MDPNELLTRLKIRRSIVISEMLKSEESDESIAKLSSIQGAITAVEARVAEHPDPVESPWNDPDFRLK
ncbi:hypothetical protein CN059_08430 [Sinorhizobium medicae]|uniref:hypothetical protein n=1 Tax=Sinorhizobium medicae TaxID=110321 RepID=UPI000FD6C5F8|nr:hypothetical protein [Sinorhizobium medicae]RVQ49510.1 hypothetical protein CN059_08430 [Sinorhizobium medicae]